MSLFLFGCVLLRWQIRRPEQPDDLGVVGAGDPGTVFGEQFDVFHGVSVINAAVFGVKRDCGA
jgi:hypothetical protein